MERGPWSVDRGPCVERGAWSVERGPWIVKEVVIRDPGVARSGDRAV